MGFLDQIQNKQQAFSKAIPGTEALAGTLKDTFGAFRNGLGIAETRSSGTCEGCGAPLSGQAAGEARLSQEEMVVLTNLLRKIEQNLSRIG